MSQWQRNDPLHRPMPDAPTGYTGFLRRARGLGASKSGAGQWWLQRVTAVALVPLIVWLLVGLVAHAGAEPAAFADWLSQPWTALPLILLLFALFMHTRLGLQVIIEDYIHHDRWRFFLVAANTLICYGLLAAGVFAVIILAV